jgi:hypothetical protein
LTLASPKSTVLATRKFSLDGALDQFETRWDNKLKRLEELAKDEEAKVADSGELKRIIEKGEFIQALGTKTLPADPNEKALDPSCLGDLMADWKGDVTRLIDRLRPGFGTSFLNEHSADHIGTMSNWLRRLREFQEEMQG